jgi:hypothetical protein
MNYRDWLRIREMVERQRQDKERQQKLGRKERLVRKRKETSGVREC